MEEQNKGLKAGQLLLNGEDLLMIVKALDVYAYSLYACGANEELEQIQSLVKIIMRKIPLRELDS